MCKNGFTIIEVMMAIFVLTVAVGGSYALIQQTLISASLNQQKLIAYYIAQEGIEIVRNIRDSNWLEQREINPPVWDAGISEDLSTGQSEHYIVDYGNQELSTCEDKNLNLDYENGLYGYSSGIPTKFKREITISKIADYQLGVSVKVEWEERGRFHNIEVVDHLYDWKL